MLSENQAASGKATRMAATPERALRGPGPAGWRWWSSDELMEDGFHDHRVEDQQQGECAEKFVEDFARHGFARKVSGPEGPEN
jgi:hypothetical protein